jgi:MacB-like periplasmic core domain
MNLRDLFLRVRALAAPRRVERELDEELAFHVERETQKNVAEGLSPSAARTRALARFGSVPLVADQIIDARGTAVVDDLARDILYAFRTFHRAPVAALTIVATVGLGLGLMSVVFTVYNTIFLRADAVRSPRELFAVERRTGPDASLPFTWPEYDAIRRETSVFTDAFAMLRPVRTRIEDRLANSVLVTGNFFQVLGVQAALGRPLTPEDDQRFAGRPVIVLSHRGWNKLFAGNPTVIGRSLLVNGVPYEIVGVMPKDFRGLGILPPDYWAPHCPCLRSRGVRREPACHRHIMRARRVGSRIPRRPSRSDRDTQNGLSRATGWHLRCRSASSRQSQLAIWFQLTNVRVASGEERCHRRRQELDSIA